jgi:hypothetical protein
MYLPKEDLLSNSAGILIKKAIGYGSIKRIFFKNNMSVEHSHCKENKDSIGESIAEPLQKTLLISDFNL